MADELVPAPLPISFAEVKDVALHFARSGYFKDAKDQSCAVVKILAGRELGFGPMASMQGFFLNSQGKLCMTANLMAAAVRRSKPTLGYDFDIEKLDDTQCILSFTRHGKEVGKSSFGLDDAKKAELTTGANSANYRKYARNMYFARAMSNGCRWYCPDVFSGAVVYTPDEMGYAVDGETGEPQVVQAEFTPVPAAVQELQNLFRELEMTKESVCEALKIDAAKVNEHNEAHAARLVELLREKKNVLNKKGNT